MREQLLIIGNGMATGRLLPALLAAAPDRYRITVVGEEPGGSYNRVLLSPLLGGELQPEAVEVLAESWYAEQGVRLISGQAVVKLVLAKGRAEWGRPERGRAELSNGEVLPFDRCILATGSRPFVPPIPGITQERVKVFRTLQDVAELRAYAREARQALVIGGGFLGLEAAAGLCRLGVSTGVIHKPEALLNRQLDPHAAELLAEQLRDRGIACHLGVEPVRIAGTGSVAGVELRDGQFLSCDLLIVATGIKPEISLAQQAGLKCDRAVCVDPYMQTSHSGVYALGECCQFEEHTYGLVAPIWQQVETLVATLCGELLPYHEEAVATKLKISGIDVFSCGDISPDHAETLEYHDPESGDYRKLWLQDKHLVGALLYGDISLGQWYHEQIQKQSDLSNCREHLLFGGRLCEPADTEPEEGPEMQKQRLVVVGNGMVGHHFVEEFQKRPEASEYQIQVLSEEPLAAYDRVHLSEYFSGSTYEDLCLVKGDTYTREGTSLHLGCAGARIDREAKVVHTEQGEFPYDTLVLATGSYPFVPPIPGNENEGCFVYRTLEDLDKIRESAKDGKTGVVVGGGLLGLEGANALKSLGLDSHVVEFAPTLMPVQLDRDGGTQLRTLIEELGVKVHTSKATTEIVAGENSRLRMNFKDGEHLETDLIMFSAGIRPRDQLARDCQLEIGERGGIKVDDHCRTSDPAIFAVGECALWNQQIFGLVGPGYQMAKVAVAAICAEEQERFTGADMSTKLKLLGVDVGSVGDAHGRLAGAKSYRYADEDAGTYKKIVVSADRKKLLGAVLVGDCSDYDTLLQYYQNGIDLPEKPQSLILPVMDGAAPVGLGPDALPDGAMLCSCLCVTKGNVCTAIDAGAMSLAEVKEFTGASTGCGGCAAMLKSVVDFELEKRGVEVSKDICEHFAYTRQDLYNLIRVEGIRDFKTLLAKHGKGLGCDICKPAAASILASCWNEHIMQKKLVPLQDTNDTFMANMQKNGTFSVVPRVAGGEITPDKLIVLGEVAKKFKLYTKITGGQRIDLFGAQLHELPQIWKELVAAGFETGQAYGKSVRTVKSCVGSTWCRYGVQDSVGMAIQIEERYKGVRAPHKVKFAVSGCTRECAEAQSKDFGVIATEKGWNLYVCGNGGMKPRHGDLFATDLDDATLIRYIDRIFMFYIKTGDRLQRTSVWMENLEGGLDYLRSVVIEDSLGLCAELEAQMQAVVDSFHCEWKVTLEDPEKLKRFRTFVNAPDDTDPQIVHVLERAQPRPATQKEISA